MKKLKAILLMLLIGVSIFGFTRSEFINIPEISASTSTDRELKGVWVTSFTGDVSLNGEAVFKNSMNNVLDVMEYYGLNALMFHVRTHNNALYPSTLNPKAIDVSNINFNTFDPIDWLIEETHKRGIEFHAWMNPYRIGTSRQVSGTLPSSNPQSNPNNLITRHDGEVQILDPSRKVVRDHIYETIEEFINLYPNIDAIHFDDYFYVDDGNIPSPGSSGYTQFADNRRNNINLLIEGVHNTINELNQIHNTYIQFGISPTGIYRNGNGTVTYDSNGHAITNGSDTRGQEHYEKYLFADTVKWANEGWIDYLMPQVYWADNRTNAEFRKILSWWNAVFKNLSVNLYTGIGVYMADEPSNTYGWQTNMNEFKDQLNYIDGYNKVMGYGIFSYQHLYKGFSNSQALSGIQVRNAYTSDRRKIKILPEVKSMTPVIPGEVGNISKSGSVLTWDASTNGKFYYIYQSSGEVTYSVDEIIGVVGGSNLTYDTGDISNSYNYGIRALSGTNHLGPIPEEEPLETYTITYNLNGGSFGYADRDEMLMDFFTDYYEFVNPSMNLNTFVHGLGQTSGYGGSYDDQTYFNQLYATNNKTVNASKGKFINQPEYNKWVPLFDLIDEYVTTVNSGQNFWGSPYTGQLRFKPFMQKDLYGKSETEPLVNKIPEEFQSQDVIYSYNEKTASFDLQEPTKEDFNFIGWYSNPSFTGYPTTTIYKGSTGNKTFYAKWEPIIPLESYTITFISNGGTSTDSQIVYEGNKVIKPADPTRTGYSFTGWYLNNYLYNFNNNVYEDLTLEAEWQRIQYTVNFSLGYNGSTLPSQTVNYGTKATKPSDPTRTNYSFLGWYLNNNLYNFNSNVYQNMNLTAKWQVDQVTVSFDLNYGNMFLESQTIDMYTTVTKPTNPERYGYEFLGWYLNEQAFNFNNTISNNITLTAKWGILFDVNPVEAIEGASIRQQAQNQKQGLRFYAALSEQYKNNPHGFYLVYGVITSEELEDLLEESETPTYNDREIFDVVVNGYDFKNEYSVVLTDIPLHGYLAKITVVPYVIIEDEIHLSNSATTRSIYDVAYNGYKIDSSLENIINEVNNNLYRIKTKSNGIEFVDSSVYDVDKDYLKIQFFIDWNKKFNTDLNGSNALSFWENARVGTPNPNDQTLNTNLTNTNIYKFFNDPIYKSRWDWLLEYMFYLGSPHVKRQVVAIHTNGIIDSNYDTYSYPGILFNANHLSYGLHNFFNASSLQNGYPTQGFSDETLYDAVKNYNDVFISSLQMGYIINNDYYKLPPITKQPTSGRRYVYTDGINYYEPETYIQINSEITLNEVQIFN